MLGFLAGFPLFVFFGANRRHNGRHEGVTCAAVFVALPAIRAFLGDVRPRFVDVAGYIDFLGNDFGNPPVMQHVRGSQQETYPPIRG